MRPNKPSNADVSKGVNNRTGVNDMEQNLEQVPLDALVSLQEVATSGSADIAALIAKFRPERQRAKRLSEYCEEIFAKIRVA
jgi:hypothetical protein